MLPARGCNTLLPINQRVINTEVEPGAGQKHWNILQELRKIPPIAVFIAGILGITVAGGMAWYFAVLIIAGVCLVVNQIHRAEVLREEKARAATYVNLNGPVVVSSLNPEETVAQLMERCEVWRYKIRMSGNPYAEKIEVIPFPYNPVLFDTLDFGGGWTIYEKMVTERKHFENLKWYNSKCPLELKPWFASAVLPTPKSENSEHI